ncbi:TRIC cation channel family protein [Actinoplanes sp. Pm04-4]|uniref:TRIC cation channel family protein n=1 Tax=Paractinoplanes pyxinae TaxID=2997416 RepID=A0ABT4ARV5_9ACTN|nr:TRIC cation channel family protein [Actinoplanes pyxinae]MCY1136968.1 TRIC cation channel family protein [Actinoplanes pyxinae]
MLLALELVGLFAFSVSGALMAIRKGFDVIGIVLLAGITALGGGVARDVIIGATPPVAFTDLGYFLMPVAAAVVTFFAHPALERLTTAVLVFDAAGLGVFCVTGTLKSLAYGLSPLPAAVLGVVTGVGGGVLRDMIARETPALVRPDAELYAVPAIAGTIAVACQPRLAVPAAVVIVAFRLVALARRWHAPTAFILAKCPSRSAPNPPC